MRSFFCVSFFFAASAFAAESEELVVDRVIAVVDNSIVLASEVESIVDAENQRQPIPDGVDKAAAVRERRALVLDMLIAEKLLEGEVRKLRIDVTAGEVDRIVKLTMQDNNLTEDQFKMALGRQGMTLDEYRDQLKKQLMKMKIVNIKVKSRVNVTEADVKTQAKREEQARKSGGFSKVRAKHVLWLVPPNAPQEQAQEAMKKALQAKAKIDSGAATFSDVAMTDSEDAGSKGRGGDLGTFGRGEMVKEFERAAFEAPVGKVVGPVRTNFGWHLILVEERVMDAPTDPDKVLEGIREQYYNAETERQFKLYIEELRRDAFIEKRL